MATDRFGRNIHYLRISLTDHCNLRCVYCMPEDMTFRPNADLMQDDEILTFARLFASLGFDKIRLTGGEPTVRANIVDIVRGISSTEGIRSVSMTTNGLLLKKLAQPLADAGLQRVNISIDTLNPDKFKRLTRWGKVEEVWEGILAAERAGLTPVKLNAVVVKGYNEEDVVDLAALTIDHPWQMRFIEMMPFGGATDLQVNQVITMKQIQDSIESEFGKLETANDGKLDGEAQVFHIHGAKGNVGFISSVTHPFCSACTRARLTADGKLRLCLLREKEVDLLTPMRAGADLEELRRLLLDGVWEKPWGHGLADGVIPLNRVMSEIGG
ncbi:MAG: GTP 3',8-cyclase MoaA [Anaerolineales bacterium]|jgi:cyclic pyranopterin phosphate synthase|uniref:GTP 3',8-cyclase MoaA n=1 Tax=Candidatus Villigracilis affinis TaxID=3140682 RepID=UPI001B5DF76B|nr:GTP 3',8-cyclase MoaA [Anaerolineales bacterium]MBK9603984.1 GTP 3',8-cyclase MoaA [Anaerolineales bacterium]MBL0347478.1 GTP 3',8-cyclase MoaA [Anaerolineales bacterium]MBP8048488.1 GTP 3',8-cyclase MoaA [Anaerolineales bacterium]